MNTTRTTARTLLASLAGIAIATALITSPVARADDEKPQQPKLKIKHENQVQNPDADKYNKDKQKAKEAEKAKDDKAEKPKAAAVGQAAPAFTLKDTEGNAVTLGEFLKDGKNIVVLEWFNPGCPYILKHHDKNKTFNDLYTKYHEKGVVFLAINSSAAGEQGSGVETNKKAKTDFALPYPILIDEPGTVGQAYGAKTTPHCFVIGKDGVLAYAGAIDDDSSQKVGKTNYVGKAIDELLAGTSVTTPSTKPYGCGVKYKK